MSCASSMSVPNASGENVTSVENKLCLSEFRSQSSLAAATVSNDSRLKSLRSPHLANGRSRYGGIGNSDDRLSTKLSTSSTSASTAIGLRSYSPVNDAASEAANGRLTRCGCLASETHQALMHSEGRRQMLLQKLKDTQDFIKLQAQKAKELEAASLEKDARIEQFQLAERDYQGRIRNAETELIIGREKIVSQQILNEQLVQRLDKLQSEMAELRTANSTLQKEFRQKVEQMTMNNIEIKALKSERGKMVQLTDKLAAELTAANGADEALKVKREKLENQARLAQRGLEQLKSEHARILTQNAHLQKQLTHATAQLESQQTQNNTLVASLHNSTAEKEQLLRQLTDLQEFNADLKASLAKTSEDKKWYFKEKLDLHQKLHASTLAYETLSKERLALQAQVDELTDELTRVKSALNSSADEKRHLVSELLSAKKVSDALTVEMATMQSRLNQQMNHVRSVEQVRDETREQCRVFEQEMARLENQLEMSNQSRKQMQETTEKNTEQLTTEILALKATCEQLKVQLEHEQSCVTSLKNSLQQLQNEKSRLQCEIKGLTEDHDLVVEKHVTRQRLLENQKADADASVKKLTSELQSLQKTLEMFQLIHQEDARLITEMKQGRDATETRSKRDETRNISDITELHVRIASLESELMTSRGNLQKQEALIFALKQKPVSSNKADKAPEEDGKVAQNNSLQRNILEMKRENDVLRRENKEQRETVQALTRELDLTRRQHDEVMEEMRRVDQEQQERIAEKFRRELVARDRQIESLEEQLAQYNDNSIRRLKRDCSRVELLAAQNRRLQNQLDDMQAMTEHEPHSLLSRTLGDEIVIHQTSNRADDKETTLVSSVGTGLRNNDTNEDLSSYPASADFDTIQCYDSIKSSPTCEQTPGQLYDVDDAGKSIGNETSACSETQCGSQKPHDGFEDSFKTTAPSDSIGSSSARDGSKGRESVREGTKRDNVSNKMSVLSVGEVNDHRFDLSAPWFNSVNDVVRDESLYGCQSAADETGADVAIHDGVSLEARQESEIVTSHRHSPSSCYVVTDAPETVESVEKPLRNCDSVAKSRTYSVGNVAKQEYSSLNGYSTDAIRDTELPAVSRAQVHPSICLMKLHQPSESSLSLSAGFDLSKQDEAGETIVSPSREETANGNVHITRKFVENPRLTELRDMDARIDDNLSCDESVKTSKPTVGAETLTVAGRSRDTDPKPLLSINGQYHGIVTVVATADCLQQHEVQFIANDEDYSVCTEDDEDDFYYTLISSCPTNRSLAAEIAAAESGLRKLAGTGSGRGSRVSSVVDADSRRGSRISAFDDDSRRNSRTWTGDDDFAAGDVIRDGRGDGLLPLDDVIQTAIDVGYNECLAEN